jgi:hypothetical protein
MADRRSSPPLRRKRKAPVLQLPRVWGGAVPINGYTLSQHGTAGIPGVASGNLAERSRVPGEFFSREPAGAATEPSLRAAARESFLEPFVSQRCRCLVAP